MMYAMDVCLARVESFDKACFLWQLRIRFGQVAVRTTGFDDFRGGRRFWRTILVETILRL